MKIELINEIMSLVKAEYPKMTLEQEIDLKNRLLKEDPEDIDRILNAFQRFGVRDVFDAVEGK